LPDGQKGAQREVLNVCSSSGGERVNVKDSPAIGRWMLEEKDLAIQVKISKLGGCHCRRGQNCRRKGPFTTKTRKGGGEKVQWKKKEDREKETQSGGSKRKDERQKIGRTVKVKGRFDKRKEKGGVLGGGVNGKRRHLDTFAGMSKRPMEKGDLKLLTGEHKGGCVRTWSGLGAARGKKKVKKGEPGGQDFHDKPRTTPGCFGGMPVRKEPSKTGGEKEKQPKTAKTSIGHNKEHRKGHKNRQAKTGQAGREKRWKKEGKGPKKKKRVREQENRRAFPLRCFDFTNHQGKTREKKSSWWGGGA